MAYAFCMMISELCINVAFDMHHIIELQIGILILYEWRSM